MSISRIQGNQFSPVAGGTTATVSVATGITQGNLMVAAVATGNNATTITGPSGWTQAVINQPAGTNATIETSLWYLVVDAAHAGQTSFTWTLSASHTEYLAISEWNSTSGWAASPLDVSAQGDTIASPVAATTISSGTTVTTAQPGELWIASLAYKGSAQTESGISTGWTRDLESTFASNNTMTMLYQVVTVTGTAGVSYSIPTAAYWSGVVATFLTAGGQTQLGGASPTGTGAAAFTGQNLLTGALAPTAGATASFTPVRTAIGAAGFTGTAATWMAPTGVAGAMAPTAGGAAGLGAVLQAAAGASLSAGGATGFSAATAQLAAASFFGAGATSVAAQNAPTVVRISAQGGSRLADLAAQPIPAPRGLRVIHAGQDISAYVLEEEEGSLLGDRGLIGGGASGAQAFQMESTLAQGAGSAGAGGARATFTTTLGPATKAVGSGGLTTGTTIVRQGEVQIYDARGNLVFGGNVTKLDDATQSISVRTVFDCVDYWQALDRVEVQNVYTGQGDVFIIKDLLSAYASWVDVSLLPTTQNYVFPKHACKGTLRQALQDIANVTGWLIYIAPNKQLRYLPPNSAASAPFSLSDTANSVSSFGYMLTKYEVDDNAIINRVYFYGGKNQSPDFTQDLSPQANGSNKVFALAYPPEDAADGKKHVLVGGVEQVVGSVFDTSAAGKLKSAGGTSDVLVNAGAQTLTFDVAPTAAQTPQAKYRYSTPLVIVLSDQQSYNFYGAWYDGRISDSTVFDVQTALQRCRLKLAQQSMGLVAVSATTWTPGLLAGQTLHITNTVRGINDTFLIQKVTANPLGNGEFEYDLELGAWNWNLLDLIVEGARILNPTDGYLEEDMSVIQARETVTSATVTTVLTKSTHASGQYYSGQAPTYSGFFTVTG